MSDQEYQPCHVEGQFVVPCSSLANAVDDVRIKHQTYVNMRTGQHTRSLIVLKAGAYQKKGVVMNHCPFCGQDISHHVKAELDLTEMER